MAITVDNTTVGSVTGAGAGAPGTNFSHTVNTTSTSSLLIAFIAGDTTMSVSSITYNSVALIQLNGAITNSIEMQEWYLGQPSTGANNLNVQTAAVETYAIAIVSYDGTNSTSPFGVTTSTTGSTVTTVTTPSVPCSTDSWFVTGISVNNNKSTSLAISAGGGSGAVVDIDGTTSANAVTVGAGHISAPSTSETATWTWTTNSAAALLASELKASPTSTGAAASSVVFRRTLSRLGTRVGSRQVVRG